MEIKNKSVLLTQLVTESGIRFHIIMHLHTTEFAVCELGFYL